MSILQACESKFAIPTRSILAKMHDCGLLATWLNRRRSRMMCCVSGSFHSLKQDKVRLFSIASSAFSLWLLKADLTWTNRRYRNWCCRLGFNFPMDLWPGSPFTVSSCTQHLHSDSNIQDGHAHLLQIKSADESHHESHVSFKTSAQSRPGNRNPTSSHSCELLSR